MSIAKVRPVGSRVPDLSGASPSVGFPWSRHYNTIYVNSGTAALATSARLCWALCKSKSKSLSPEIILPAYGCPDLVAALVACNIKPVMVDVSQGLPWMSLESVKGAVTDNTVAIMAVGFLGVSERLGELRAIADRADVFLIEDSAQVMPPASSDNAVADFCVLSFGRGKPVNLMGGGALLIRRDHLSASSEIIDRMDRSDLELGVRWRLRRQIFNLLLLPSLYGILERIPHLGIGETVFNPLASVYRLNNLEGLLARGYAGLLNRPALEGQYMETFGFLVDRGWSFPTAFASCPQSSRYLLRFPLLAPSETIRDAALKALNRCGIGASAFYGRSLPRINQVGRFIDSGPEDFPNAADFASRLLTLPIHEDVRQSDINVMSTVLSRYG